MSHCVEGKNCQFGKMKKFQKRIAVMVVHQWESAQCHSELLKMVTFILYIFYHNLFFFLNKRTHLAMGCGDTDGNLEKSFYQNFSPRKLCDERQDDVRGEHPVGRWERQVSSWVFWSQPRRALQSETEWRNG